METNDKEISSSFPLNTAILGTVASLSASTQPCEAANFQHPSSQAYPHASPTSRTRKGVHTDMCCPVPPGPGMFAKKTECLTLQYADKPYQTTSFPREGKAGSHEQMCTHIHTYTHTLSLGQSSGDKSTNRKRGLNIMRGTNTLEKRM